MTNWLFRNLTVDSDEIAIKSADHAVELFMEASGENEYGVCLEFSRSPTGVIDTIAGPEFGTLAFDPNYDSTTHSLSGFRSAIPSESKCAVPFYFDDGTCTSSVSAESLVGVLQIVKAIYYILEHNDYPPFLEWRPGC